MTFKMAGAENAVIVADNGTQVTYHPKCPYCGKVEQNVTTHAHVSNGVTVNDGMSHCFKCGKSLNLRFGRG